MTSLLYKWLPRSFTYTLTSAYLQRLQLFDPIPRLFNMSISIFKIIWEKWNPPIDPVTQLQSKAVLLTGASSGLGYQAALKYAQLGAATVILAVRNLRKGEHAKASIEQITGRN